MTDDKIAPDGDRPRGEPVRRRVLDAAEALLREGQADFSMRDLAAAAGVSFATPFNRFGSKAAILQALSARRIDAMEARFRAQAPEDGGGRDAATRVLLAVDTAAAVMLEEPGVNRAVMASLGAAEATPGRTRARSAALWALALGAGEGLVADRRAAALRCLPDQLAVAFRGALSFWTAGELADEELAPVARGTAAGLLLGYRDRPA